MATSPARIWKTPISTIMVAANAMPPIAHPETWSSSRRGCVRSGHAIPPFVGEVIVAPAWVNGHHPLRVIFGARSRSSLPDRGPRTGRPGSRHGAVAAYSGRSSRSGGAGLARQGQGFTGPRTVWPRCRPRVEVRHADVPAEISSRAVCDSADVVHLGGLVAPATAGRPAGSAPRVSPLRSRCPDEGSVRFVPLAPDAAVRGDHLANAAGLDPQVVAPWRFAESAIAAVEGP